MKAALSLRKMVRTESGYYEYDELLGYWKPIPNQDIARWVLRIFQNCTLWYWKPVKAKGEIDYERREIETSEPYFFKRFEEYASHANEIDEPDFFKSAPVGFTCKNGFVCVDPTGAHLKRAEEVQHSRIYLDCDFLPDVGAPFTTSVIASYFTLDEDRIGKQRALYEFMAYCLLGQMCFDERGTILWVTGAKRSGKTTLLKSLIQAIFPSEFVGSVEPQAFSDPNRKLDLVGKLINFRDEIGTKALTDVGTIKNIVSGAVTNIKKLYHDPIQARIDAGHLFIANEMPLHADPTGALQDRTIHIHFDQKYDREPESPAAIRAKMETERPGILNLLLSHYYEAQARPMFEERSVFVPESAKLSRDAMTREANAYIEFIEDALEEDKQARVSIQEIADKFDDWKRHTRRTQGPSPHVSTLGKKILAERPEFRVGFKARATVYGVRFRDFNKKVD